jgi:hypothetical protein
VEVVAAEVGKPPPLPKQKARGIAAGFVVSEKGWGYSFHSMSDGSEGRSPPLSHEATAAAK